MKDLKLNADYTDLDTTDGKLHWVYGDEALVQRLVIRLNMERGSYIHNTEMGIPYLSKILVRNPDLNLIRSLFKNEIEKDPEVNRVIRLNISLSTDRRTLLFEAEIEKIDETVVNLTSLDYNTEDQSSSNFLILTINPSTIL